MRCTVLFFSQLRESVGRDELTIELPDGANVADALDALAAEYPPIAALRGRLAAAVDETYQPLSARLRDGCTLALIPPVSGG